ncbi:MAG: o-succinylbenzoate synthase [Actinomycetaceae bacterium]|nr:o-succinylbenzoate synthase [Actinomycetaceae bacterium]
MSGRQDMQDVAEEAMTQTPRVAAMPMASLGPTARALFEKFGIDELLLYTLPMKVRFRGISLRHGLLIHGPGGWGEVAPFVEYDDHESASWLVAGLETARRGVPAPVRDKVSVNVTVPIIGAREAWELVSKSGCTTAKVKVAEPGYGIGFDLGRLSAVRDALGPEGKIRIDANAGWDIDEAKNAIQQYDRAAGGLEYVEQPCQSIEDMIKLRAMIDVPVAADECVRRAKDPLAGARAGAADILVFKAMPLGGPWRALELAQETDLPIVVSSALGSTICLYVGMSLAAALPSMDFACGLGTSRMFLRDVTDEESRIVQKDGFYTMPQTAPVPDRSVILYDENDEGLERLKREWVARLEDISNALVNDPPPSAYILER